MIKDICQVIDKTIAILGINESNVRILFEDHIQPLYMHISHIDTYYRSLFVDVIQTASNDEVTLSDLSIYLLTLKRDLDELKFKIDSLRNTFDLVQSTALPAEITNFCRYILGYYSTAAETAPTSFLERGGNGYSTLIWEIQGCLEANCTSDARERLARLVSQLIPSWLDPFLKRITDAYSQARTNALQ